VNQYNKLARPTQSLEIFAFGPEDLYSGPGEYAQEVVNQQLNDYEIYVGLWRESRGTPTPVAPSGTVEEMRNALNRHKKWRRPWVMAYFWKFSQTDFNDVKDDLKINGCYYHHFDNPQHLQQIFLNHLTGYLRDKYRLPGHSTTQLRSRVQESVLSSVFLTFYIFSPEGGERKISCERAFVAVGRQPEKNEIVINDQRVHREQGLFLYKEGVVFYVDLAGDSLVQRNHLSIPNADQDVYGQDVVNVGDAVVLPDGSRIVLRAVV
jgi:hypothetical protein